MPDDSIIIERPFTDSSRPFGVSGILRLKNAAATLEKVVEAFIPHLDEVVAVYSDCEDNTPQILEELKMRYPEKLKVYEYPASVAAIDSREHHTVGRFSPESIANYYNWAFQKASFSVVTKIDHDHLPIDLAFSNAVSLIRESRPQHFIYTYSGLNLAWFQGDDVGVPLGQVFVGMGDHWFLDVGEDLYFEHLPLYENLVFDDRRQRRHLGLLYWHIKRLLPGYVGRRRDVKYTKAEEVIRWYDFKNQSGKRFSLWRHRARGSYRRAFEGRPYWLVRILLCFPNLRGFREKRLFKNVCGLRYLPEFPKWLKQLKS